MPPRKQKIDINQALLLMAETLQAESLAPNIKKYKPHLKQHEFHASTKKKKLYIGGNRSGKTTGGVTEAIWRATCTHPYRPELNAIGPNRGRVVAVDFVNGIEKIILPQYKQWIYPSALRGGTWETAYQGNTKTLHFSNGSFIEFMSYDQNLDKFAGTSRHWVHFDEEPPKSVYIECLARLVDTNGEFWITMTPVEGMTWIYDDLWEPNENKPEEEADVKIVIINTLENPYLSVDGIKTLMDSMDDDNTQARIAGAFVQQGGRIFKNFDPTVGGPHVLSDSIRDPRTYFPSSNWLWILALDHGLNNPTAVLWLAVNDDGFVVCFDEWYHSDYTVDKHAQVIKQKIREHGRFPDLLVADPAIAQRNGVTNTNIQQEYQKYDLSFILGNNDVKAGIIRTKKYFQPVAYPLPVGRRHPLYGGLKVLPGASDTVTIKSEDGKYPRLVIDPRCGKLIWELKKYRWKTYSDKKKQYENNPYDEPHKKDDHACDALRYAIMTRPDLVANNTDPSPEQLAEAMKEFNSMQRAVEAGDMDDPRGLLQGGFEEGWNPSHSLPSNGGFEWSVDEHLGGIY